MKVEDAQMVTTSVEDRFYYQFGKGTMLLLAKESRLQCNKVCLLWIPYVKFTRAQCFIGINLSRTVRELVFMRRTLSLLKYT
jgi:hypothetical protein